ncbi:cytochrome d ubiquinol oxidase subunit II [Candidatus Deianiraea vastatrix]|uniref:Cytochrome d ubiquinol oxidase subunit II n=1 Tax=Candidatus Deianiraea vastatrix TaxID=2163644 RepID=A0A5B8XIS1_9RICK|nr:cytochrome d ubiquinol oxidase subunit II [Candidatus Deianiraea vastatrix]QED23844.1 Cytochrome d ubiquinol oxidase subunit II [Candidatus Deianiraea vastatrix]
MLCNCLIANIIGFLMFFSIIMFVFFDGMDLGIGILSPFMKNKEQRGLAMASVHPFWDVNETWIIMAAIFLVLGFTNAYGIFITTFYIPVILLLGLAAFRGCSFEFRSKDEKYFKPWDIAFFVSSFGMALVFGVFIGNLVNGLNIGDDMLYKGTFWQLFNPIALASGVLNVLGFALIGAAWVCLKTPNDTSDFARKAIKTIIKLIIPVSIILAALVFSKSELRERIFGGYRICLLSVMMIASYCVLGYMHKLASSSKGNEVKMLFCAYGFALYGAIALLSITYPYVVPYKYTMHDLLRFKSDTHGMENISIFTIILLIITLGFFFKNYRVFKGKFTKDDIHY